MINVSEATGVFTIPLGIHFSNVIWNFMNEIGIIFIPFFLVILQSVNKARAMGRDEGSPQIMALKLIEGKFIAMFTILFTFVMPVNLHNQSVPTTITSDPHEPINFRAFSCNAGRSSIIAPTDRVNPRLTNFNGYDMGLPMMLGLANQGIQGFTNTMIAKIPCDTNSISRINQGRTQVMSSEKDSKIQYSMELFYKTCYTVALNNINTAIDRGTFNNYTPLTEKETRFTSAVMMKGYGGAVINPQTGNFYDPLTATVDVNQWVFNPNGVATVSDPTKEEVSCTFMAQDIASAGITHINKNYGDEVLPNAKTTMMYPDRDGTTFLTLGTAKQEVEDRLVNQLMFDVALDTKSMFNTVQGASPVKTIKADNSAIGEAGVYVATFLTTIEKGIANQAYGLLGPILISLLISLALATGPLLIVISGYNTTVALMIVYLLCFLIGTQYVFEIGLYVETVLLEQGVSALSTLSGDADFNLKSLLLSTVIPTILGVWSMLGAMLGILVIPMFSQMIQTASNNIASYGMGLVMRLISILETALSAVFPAAGALKGVREMGSKLSGKGK